MAGISGRPYMWQDSQSWRLARSCPPGARGSTIGRHGESVVTVQKNLGQGVRTKPTEPSSYLRAGGIRGRAGGGTGPRDRRVDRIAGALWYLYLAMPGFV
jgi:hypothetical protein